MTVKRRKKMPELEAPITGRACWSCASCYFSQSEPGYSEYTPGSNFGLECTKGYWDLDTDYGSNTDLRDCILSAERCAEFSLHPSIDR